jgi:uncharacterized protein YaiE (UPF0345 family)
MVRLLKGEIKLVNALPIQTLTGTANITTTHPGSVLDTKLSEMYSFDTALFQIQIGVLANAPTVKVKVQEANKSDFTDASNAAGGEEITVAANSSYKMEIERTKRYLRALVTMTSGATAGTVVIYVGATLCNWEKPFPTL